MSGVDGTKITRISRQRRKEEGVSPPLYAGYVGCELKIRSNLFVWRNSLVAIVNFVVLRNELPEMS